MAYTDGAMNETLRIACCYRVRIRVRIDLFVKLLDSSSGFASNGSRVERLGALTCKLERKRC